MEFPSHLISYPGGHVRIVALGSAPGHPKVRELGFHGGGQEDVGGLEVPVDYLRGGDIEGERG